LAGTFATGALLPVAVWFFISTSTGSPFWPDENYLNVAMTYFDEVGDGHSGESRMRMAEEFDSLRDVLLHDPPHILRSYVRDAFRTLWRTFSPQVLLAFPLSILALLGAVPLLLRSRSFMGCSLIALTVAQMMLINLKTFEARYYLFLVPLYGAGLGILMSLVSQKLNQKYRKAVVATTAFVLGLIAIGSFAEAWAAVHANDVEIEGAVTRAGGMLDEASVVVSRKPHLPFYWGLAAVDFPDVGSIDELRDNLEPLAEQSIVYLYYGSQEQRLKPQFYEILDPSNGMLPPWLTPVAEGDIGTQVWTTRHFVRILLGRKDGWSNRGKWILYRFHPTTGSGMSGEVPREALPRR